MNTLPDYLKKFEGNLVMGTLGPSPLVLSQVINTTGFFFVQMDRMDFSILGILSQVTRLLKVLQPELVQSLESYMVFSGTMKGAEGIWCVLDNGKDICNTELLLDWIKKYTNRHLHPKQKRFLTVEA